MASVAPKKKIRLGDLLVEKNLISESQLMQALSNQKKTGLKLGRQLITNDLISEEQLVEFLSVQLRIPFIDLKHFKLEPQTVN